MTMTATAAFLEARCSRCWNSNCFPTDSVGQTVDCRHCGNGITVPEATPERIARAEALLAEQPELLEQTAPTMAMLDRPLTEREINEIVRKESTVPLDQMDFSGYPVATITSRCFATLIDQVLLVMAFAMGLFLVTALAHANGQLSPFGSLRAHGRIVIGQLIVMNCLPVMVVICQWVLLATSGQTVGKKLLMIRIVTSEGRLPSFIQSVVIRNWVRNLLYMFPFVAIIDYALSLGETKRCGHDWISFTKVVALV